MFKLIAPFEQATKDLGIAQVTKVSDQFVSAVKSHKQVIAAMSQFKKPSDFNFLCESLKKVVEEVSLVKQKDFKAPPNHLQTVIDGFSLLSWFVFGNSEELYDFTTEYYNAIFFYGNKVLKLEKEKDSKWFNAYADLCKAHFDFVLARRDSILLWTGSQDPAGLPAFLSGSQAPAIS